MGWLSRLFGSQPAAAGRPQQAPAAVPDAPAAAAQSVVTLYGGARAGGEFIDKNAGDAVIKLDGGAAASLTTSSSLIFGTKFTTYSAPR